MTVVPADQLHYEVLPGRSSADPFAGLAGGETSVRQVTIEGAESRSPHRHPHSEEVIYVVSGSGRVWVDGVFHPVGPGTWYRIPAGVAHATAAAPGEQVSLVCFFPHDDLANNIEELDMVIDLKEET